MPFNDANTATYQPRLGITGFEARYGDGDDPGSLSRPLENHFTDYFEDYFVFRPGTKGDGSGSIWVTLGKAKWKWHGAVRYKSSDPYWEWADSQFFEHSQAITESTQIPEWKNRKIN